MKCSSILAIALRQVKIITWDKFSYLLICTSVFHICVSPLYPCPNLNLVLVPKQLEFQQKTTCVLKFHCSIEVTCFESVTYCIASCWWYLRQWWNIALTRLKQTHSLYISKAFQPLYWYYGTEIAPEVLQTQFLASAKCLQKGTRGNSEFWSPLWEKQGAALSEQASRDVVVQHLKGALKRGALGRREPTSSPTATHRRGSESLGFSLNVRRTIQKRVYFSVNLSKQLNYVEILYNLFEWHDGTNPLKTYLVLLRCDEVPMA